VAGLFAFGGVMVICTSPVVFEGQKIMINIAWGFVSIIDAISIVYAAKMVNKSRQVLAVEREAEDMVKQICFS
jgi:hypothetical protein